MNLEKSVHDGLSTIFDNFFNTLVDTIKERNAPKICKCMHKFTRGKNAGSFCTSNATNFGYCGRHQSSVTETMGTIVNKGKNLNKKPKAMTKTQLQIIEWLNTAVPQTETVLKKRSKGLLHEETDIIFDQDFTVVGKLNNGNIVKISDYEVELCEKNGWVYDPDVVESEDSS